MPVRVRMLVIAAVLILAAVGCLISLGSLVRQDLLLSQKLAEQEKVYQELQDKRLSILRDTNRLKNDSEYQRETLKKEFGYVEENQIPLITVPPEKSPGDDEKTAKSASE